MRQTFFTRDIPEAELHQHLLNWFGSSPGRELLELETDCANRLLKKIFGIYLLEAGFPGDVQCPGIRLPINLGCWGSERGSRLRGLTTQMPLQSDSVDAVLLAHALDFSADPHQVLRETDRILIPEGRLILFGFNPYSIWGLRRITRFRRHQAPWSASFIPRGRVVDWLYLLGFEVEIEEHLMFRPPLAAVGWMRGTRFLESAGARFWAPLSAVYVIQAVKRVSRLTPIQPSWKFKRIIKTSIAEPTARTRGPHGRSSR